MDGCLEFNQMHALKQILLFLPKRNKMQITKSLISITLQYLPCVFEYSLVTTGYSHARYNFWSILEKSL